ncbi:hypothetical protein RQP46_002370 [Phenoliferia psychrophenolica]
MAVKTIFIVRHGDKQKPSRPRPSLDMNVWKTPIVPQGDPLLSSHGRDQAAQLGAWLATLPESERPQAIYASPLFRTLETATPAALLLSLPIEIEHGLSEWLYPVKRGLHPLPHSSSDLALFFPLINPTSHPSLLSPHQKGETSLEFHARAKELVKRLVDKLEGGDVERILLVTHAAYERDEEGAWEQKMNGASFMLEMGEERHWDFSHVVRHLSSNAECGPLEDPNDDPLEQSDLYPPSEDEQSMSADLFVVPEGLLAQ